MHGERVVVVNCGDRRRVTRRSPVTPNRWN